jgi:hypothetical protein
MRCIICGKEAAIYECITKVTNDGFELVLPCHLRCFSNEAERINKFFILVIHLICVTLPSEDVEHAQGTLVRCIICSKEASLQNNEIITLMERDEGYELTMPCHLHCGQAEIKRLRALFRSVICLVRSFFFSSEPCFGLRWGSIWAAKTGPDGQLDELTSEE